MVNNTVFRDNLDLNNNSQDNMTVEVKIKQGLLKGQQCNYIGKEYYSFEGIPYAKPPIENLRFQEPQEPESWTGVRDALKPGNSCLQVKPGKKEFFGSEDCLYLNVYTPSLPEKELKRLPVLIYIHGGKFVFGFGDYYRPEYLIEQNVILVTLNYRLHALGFLCLNIPEAAGNMGLKDTVMALKWVKNNISKFNGDENNIVAFGESAGAGILTSYLTSDMANGLVNKIVALSGCCISDMFITDDDPVFKAKRLASIHQREFNDVRSLYNYLIQLPAVELLHAAALLEFSTPSPIITSYFLPVVEKEFEGVTRYFTEPPIVTLREKRHKNVPVLFGLAAYEGGPFVRQDKCGNIIYENDFRYFIPRFFFVQPYSYDATKIAKKLRNFYFDGAVVDETQKVKYINFLSDIYFNRDILAFLNMLGKRNDGLYVFRFSHLSEMNTSKMKQLGVKGTTHGDILPYIFYRKKKVDIANEKDKEVMSVINEFIGNFARTGIPTWTKMSVVWKPYTDNKRSFVDIDEEQKLLQDFGNGIDTFWNSLGQRSKL